VSRSIRAHSFTAHRKALRFIYGPSEGRTVHFTDRKQDLRPAWSTVWKATQKVPREGIFYIFLLHFIVLLKQITEAIHKRFYFQVPLVYNYSTYYTEESPIYFLCFTVLFLAYFFYILRFY
jgi:hypothetical protein